MVCLCSLLLLLSAPILLCSAGKIVIVILEGCLANEGVMQPYVDAVPLNIRSNNPCARNRKYLKGIDLNIIRNGVFARVQV